MARRSGQGSDAATGWTGPRAFIRATQTMKCMAIDSRMAACCVAVHFVATGQPGYLSLGDRDGLSIPVRIDAPGVPRS
jgi:hypothetical protein